MNYYPRYPGDYVAKTIDLTMVEDGAYTRLLDWYYSNEQPIQHGRRHLIARATTAPERAAVDTVLGKFFLRDGTVYRHERVAEEIAKAHPRIEAAKANGAKGGRRPKNPPGNPVGFENDNPNGTHRETQWASSPAPAPSPTPEEKTSGQPTPATARGAVGLALKRAGLQATSMNLDDPRLTALLDAGATPAEFEGIAREAIAKGVKSPWGWVLKVVQSRREDAATAVTGMHRGTLPSKQQAVEARNRAVADEWLAQQEGASSP